WTFQKDKEIIRRSDRRVFGFIYQSRGAQVRGALSYIPEKTDNPLIYYCRGGTVYLGFLTPVIALNRL
ncbi:hypothetical protein N9Y92_04620, partial [Chlamydiales bacterium]|nr:hypothetical protein [Chlamydiales bacterium]